MTNSGSVPRALANAQAMASLRRRWVVLAALWSSALLLGYLLLRASWGPEFSIRWASITALVLAYLLWQLSRRLERNHRPGESALLPALGPGNQATLLRGLAIGLMAGFLFLPRPAGGLAWAPALLYTLSDVLDYFDGYLARIADHATLLGEGLDLELDALGLLVAVGLAVWYGSLFWWFLPIGLARYAFAFGLWVRKARGLPVYDLPESVSRRPIAGLTMGFLSAALWPIVSPPASVLAGTIFLLPFASSFGRDWLVVSGAIDPDSERYRALRASLKSAAARWFPLPFRVVLVATILPSALQRFIGFAAQVEQFGGLGYQWPVFAVAAFGVLEAGGAVLILLGAAGRAAAFALLFPVGLTIVAQGLTPLRAAVLTCVLVLLMLGTGEFSLWKPEERIFRQRAGAARG